MRFSAPLVFAGFLQTPAALARYDLDSFIADERVRSWQGVLENIGALGAKVPGASSGVVVASPSTADPDYFYTWTRDAAVAMKEVVDAVIDGQTSYEAIVEEYVTSQAILQTVTNPSGMFFDGAGLGEPKFRVEKTVYNAPWGRPQRDGPAIRAITLMTYVDWLLDQSSGKHASRAMDVVWPVVLNDLNYIGHYWNQTGFDLWEEVHGSSFFTLQMQHRALAQGINMASKLANWSPHNVSCLSCESQAPQILCFLQHFWNGKHIVSNINVNNGRAGLDTNTLLGSIHNLDINARCDDLTFQPCNSRSLANFKAVVDSFRPLYCINQGIAVNSGIAVGRYAEDVYYGGNPWYLCTLAAAEFLYNAAAQLQARRSVTIDNVSFQFYLDIHPSAEPGTIEASSPDMLFQQIVSNMVAYADSFVAVVKKYTSLDGSLSEQFDRNTGAPLSAADLTWSYASFISMSSRRAGIRPQSWGASQIMPPPATCVGTSAKGNYCPAVAAGAPNIPDVCTTTVTFNVNASTYYGESVLVVGAGYTLGDWNPSMAAPMSAERYYAYRPLWTLTKDLPASTNVSYKYIRQEVDGSHIFEIDDRTIRTHPCEDLPLIIEDAWDWNSLTSQQ